MRVMFLSLIFLAACTGGPSTETGSADGEGAASDVNSVTDIGPVDTWVAPTQPTDLPEGWSVIKPGGETICSRGSDFLFLVRKGSVNRVVIDFMGGGACWNEQSCSFADAIFNEDLSAFEDVSGESDLDGIYDVSNEANPFKDWYHVVVPYCTGDIHWGDSVVDYGADAGTIHHKGAVNTRAVLDWMGKSFSAPDKIFVTGCSAGAYGAIGWSPHIIEQFPSASVYQMGDAGVGVITENFFKDSFPKWNAWGLMPDWIDSLNLDEEGFYELGLEDLYIRIANHYPDVTFSQFTTAFDKTQVFYYKAMGGGDADAWAAKMQASLDEAKAGAVNFRAFVAAGDQHCILPYANFYTMEAAGVVVSDWVTDMVDDQPIDHVHCDPCE